MGSISCQKSNLGLPQMKHVLFPSEPSPQPMTKLFCTLTYEIKLRSSRKQSKFIFFKSTFTAKTKITRWKTTKMIKNEKATQF